MTVKDDNGDEFERERDDVDDGEDEFVVTRRFAKS